MIANDKKPIGERVKRSDDHQRYLRAKEDPDHHDQHQCCALGVALANLQKNSDLRSRLCPVSWLIILKELENICW